jgi:spore germination protein GerM
MPALTPGRRPGAAAVLALVMAVAGCGVPTDSQPRDIPNPLTRDSGQPGAVSAGSAVVRIYLVRDGRLVRVAHRVPSPLPPKGELAELLKGPTATDSGNGLTSALSTTDVLDVTVTDRRATVDIGSQTGQGARSDETLAYGQIVCTLTSQGAEVGTVSFLSDGMPLAVPRADGSLSDGPLTIADYSGLLDS